MAIFNINGTETDSVTEAHNLVQNLWHAHKAPAVLEQRKAALAKPTPLDLERAEAGVTPDLGSAAASKLGRVANGGQAVVS